LRPIYILLLSTLLMTLFYALFSWRSYVERERTMAHLRPFVASQRLYEQLLASSSPSEVDAVTPFQALCEDVLGARLAYLVPVGPLAPLVDPALAYPQDAGTLARPPSLAELIPLFASPQTICTPLDSARYGGARWAVPLWSERGLIGVLLLGEKRDGGLYTQEEIEIARASGERLIDTRASAALARRLMALQRQRLIESQVLDRRARRALHDDVLPQLHTAMLSLSGGGGASDVVALLGDVHGQLSDLLREMPAAAPPELDRLGLIGALRQVVDEELESAFDDVTWRVEPVAERGASAVPALTAEVVFYAAREAIRNAARYGRGGVAARPLHLQVSVLWRGPPRGSPASKAPWPGQDEGGGGHALSRQTSEPGTRAQGAHGGLEILIEDDGVGLEAQDGLDEGRGQGLALHSTMMAVIGGSLALESLADVYTRVWLVLPGEAW
jgi:signal transduction histidine kinase